MSKYFRIVSPSEPEQIGVDDGMAQSRVKRSKFKDVSNYDKFYEYFMSFDEDYHLRYTQFPPFEISLEYVELRNKAILTDFLTFAPVIPQEYLVNGRVRDILLKFRLPPFKFYPVALFSKNIASYDYSLFYYPLLGYEYVDFKNSIFSQGIGTMKKRCLGISTMEDFQNLRGSFSVDKLVLNKDFDLSLDFFSVSVSVDPIISERLRDELTVNNVSGIEIKRLNFELDTSANLNGR